MKKISILLTGFVLMILIISCNNQNQIESKEAVVDLDSCIVKLNSFNDQFNKFYDDEVITIESAKGATCEFTDLMELANGYFSIASKINDRINEDAALVAKGEKSTGYDKAYKNAMMQRQTEYEAALELFTENFALVENTIPVDL